MPGEASGAVKALVETVYRTESRRILATLIRLLGDFDLAEEALHEAFFVAVERWQRDGVPDNPRTWLVSTGRFKAIDALRRRARFSASRAHWSASWMSWKRPTGARKTWKTIACV
jgi:RNA polymerase sigma-70 factor (ECF subfamily)